MQTSEKRLRLAVVGLGKQGQEHIDAADLCRDVEIVAGVDPAAAQRDKVALRYPSLNLHMFASVAELAGESLDGLILALPHHCYESEWQDILNLRLPLLKEKPLGRTWDEAMAFLRQARMYCPLQTAIQRRHHPSYRFLQQELQRRGARIHELHAHMHLGFAPSRDESWRGSLATAGGGALLDSGYHMIDLLHFLCGPFDLVSATLWRDGKPAGVNEIEDRAMLTGRSETCWVSIDSWVSGAPDSSRPSGFAKSEAVEISTDQGRWYANREGVWLDDEQINAVKNDWRQAMAEQLDRFASNVRGNTWHDDTIWDQLPAMRLIDDAYQRAHMF